MKNKHTLPLTLSVALSVALASLVTACGDDISYVRIGAWSVLPTAVATPVNATGESINLSYRVEAIPGNYIANWWLVPIGATDDKVANTSPIYLTQCTQSFCVNNTVTASCKVTTASDDANARLIDCGSTGATPQRLARGKYRWVARASNLRTNSIVGLDSDQRDGEIEFW